MIKRQNFGDGYLTITRSHGDERLKIKLQTSRNDVWHEINFKITPCHIGTIAEQIHRVLDSYEADIDRQRRLMGNE